LIAEVEVGRLSFQPLVVSERLEIEHRFHIVAKCLENVGLKSLDPTPESLVADTSFDREIDRMLLALRATEPFVRTARRFSIVPTTAGY